MNYRNYQKLISYHVKCVIFDTLFDSYSTHSTIDSFWECKKQKSYKKLQLIYVYFFVGSKKTSYWISFEFRRMLIDNKRPASLSDVTPKNYWVENHLRNNHSIISKVMAVTSLCLGGL